MSQMSQKKEWFSAYSANSAGKFTFNKKLGTIFAV